MKGPAVLQDFIIKLIITAAKDPEIQKLGAEALDKIKAEILPDLIALFPTFGSGIIKAALDALPNVANLPEAVELAESVAKNIVDADPDIPGLSNVIDLSEILRKWLP
ncbi:hypothetical protein [Mycobacterium sp. 48b]|uniref:hypothetical protein n=1 Tax=Mycobacterium sp. 48b TaxID=3400426 RepID=UPI003AB03311